MKNMLFSFGIILSFLSSVILMSLMIRGCEKNQILPSGASHFGEPDDRAENMDEDWIITQDPALKSVPSGRLADAYRRIKAMKEDASLGLIGHADMPWDERGPNNVGGRTRTFLFDSRDPTNNTAFAAGVTGGIWKTTNFMSDPPTWNPVNDFWENLNVGTIVQDPDNPEHFYAGTGETFAPKHRGFGIWKSTDGGNTWNQLASTTGVIFQYVHKLLFDANGHLYACTKEGGLQKSIDKGITWSKVLGSGIAGATTDLIADIELAGDGDLYVSMGGGRVSDDVGVFKSDFSIHAENTGNLGTWTGIPLPLKFSRIELASAPSNPDVIFAVCVGITTGTLDYLYRSSDGGMSWEEKTAPFINANSVSQASYNLALAVDPKNDNTLICGAVSWFKSLDAGDSWIYTLLGHADQHAFVFVPTSASYSDSAVVCNDGGIYLAREINSNPTVTRNISKNSGYNVTQFYGGDLNPMADSDYYIAGAQDNGGIILPNMGISEGVGFTGSASFTGDCGYSFIDDNDPNFQIIAAKGNSFYVSSTLGGIFTLGLNAGRGIQVNRCDYDDDVNVLYAARDPDFVRWNNPQSGSDYDIVTVTGEEVSYFNAIRVSPNIPNRVYFSSDNGRVFYVDDAHTGTTKTGVTIRNGNPDQFYSCIEIEEGNEDHILVTYSNYGVVSIFETHNATDPTPTWTAVEGNLPDMPVRWVMFVPGNADQALIATETGVWITEDLNGGSTVWAPCTQFPNVRTDMLRWRSSDNRIMAITHGRGIFTTDYFNQPCDFYPDYDALAAIYAANPDNTLGWNLSNCDVCKWEGVTCNTSGRVQRLSLDSKNLSSLPPEIGQLPSLELLDLPNNQLSSLPPEIGQLTNLNNLRLPNNQLNSLPPEIGQLTNLAVANLAFNQLSSLPPEFGQMANLSVLFLWDNQLNSLPSEIGQLTSLVNLRLDRNQLSKLPPEIGQLTNLTVVNISGNQFESLPPQVGQLSSLVSLVLFGNQLSSLPPEIGQLANLSQLRLENNELSCLPPEMSNLCSNANITVTLTGNPFPYIWEQFCTEGLGKCCNFPEYVDCNPVTVILDPIDGTYQLTPQLVAQFNTTVDPCVFDLLQVTPSIVDCSDIDNDRLQYQLLYTPGDGTETQLCWNYVRVRDKTFPHFTNCPSSKYINLEPNTELTLTPEYLGVSADDNCTVTLATDPDPFIVTSADNGETLNVPVIATDEANLTATCTVAVTVSVSNCSSGAEAPDNLTAAVAGPDVVLSWDPVGEATEYNTALEVYVIKKGKGKWKAVNGLPPTVAGTSLAVPLADLDAVALHRFTVSVSGGGINCEAVIEFVPNELSVASLSKLSPNNQTNQSASLGLQLFPNPTSQSVTLSWQSDSAGPARMQVFDLNGAVLRTVALQSVKGWNQHEEEVSALPAGTYWIRLVDGKRTEVRRMIKLD